MTQLRLEPLERRDLLNGLTIITHGLNGNIDGWVKTMGESIEMRANAQGGEAANLVVKATYPLLYPLQPIQVQATTQDFPPDYNGQVILKFDWSGIGVITNAGEVADALASYLLANQQAILQGPIHLIGHSRGGVLVSQLAKEFGQHGLWVDQLTTLDPYPVNDPDAKTYDNVVFADNYYQKIQFPEGDVIPGAYNDEVGVLFYNQDNWSGFLGNCNYLDPSRWGDDYHKMVHDWYYGTINLTTDTDPSPADRSYWYHTASGQQVYTGFYYSQIVGGRRPSCGTPIGFGGTSASYTSTEPSSDPQWPNVMLANAQSVWSATAGDTINIKYWANDRDVTSGTTTLTFGTDTDQNPYNGVLTTLPSAGVASVTTTTGNGQPHVYSWRPNVSDDGHYFYAKITDQAHTRYYYLPKPFSITSPPTNTIAPTASIASTFPNPASGIVSAAATATAANGQAISRVAFLLDGSVVFTDYSSPYLWSWDTTQAANGAHTIKAIAYDTSGLSGNSAPVTVTINNGADIRPPVISHLRVTTSSTTAVFTWTTDEPATAQVEYGTSPTPPNTGYSPPNLNLLTAHSITLTNLSPETTYYGRVFDRDAASNLAYSGNIAFVTSATANTAPQITLGQPAAGTVWAANTLQTITWSASDDVAVTGISLYYSTDYGDHWNLIAGNVANTGSYVWTVPSINSTTVRVRAVAFDGSGASGEDTGSGDFTIIPSNPGPTTPILNSIVPDRAAYTVSWSTVAGATYVLEEDTSAAFTNPVRYSLSTTSRFFYNRLPGTYYYRVSATNVYGQSTPSSPQLVTLNYDLGPGTIGAISPADDATAQPLAVTLNWSASNPGGQALRYTVYVAMGDTESYFPGNVRASDQTTSSLTVTDLPYNTTISWGVRATDASGLVTWSPMFHFTTRADTTAPTGSISINNGAATTDTYAVTLFANATDADSGVQLARFSNDGSSWSDWSNYAPQVAWNLADNRYGGQSGLTTYTVYAQFRDQQGNISGTQTDTIDKATGTPGNIILNGQIYFTIQEAINAAQPGDTVYLTEGHYSVYGNASSLRPWDPNTLVGIVMRPGVTLRGAGASKTTITFDNSLYGLVDSDNAVIEGLTIVNPSFPGTTVSGVLFESNSSKVRNCTLRGSYYGICSGYSGRLASNNEISNNLIINNGTGISVTIDSHNVSVFNNTIAYNSNYTGIMTQTDSLTITNNIIAFNQIQISGYASPVPTIQSNDVYSASGQINYQGPPDQTGSKGNISSDPLFVNVGNGDYHLASSSPAIDRGVNVGYPFAGSDPDMGAFEANASGTVAVTTNRADSSFTVTGPQGTYFGTGTSLSMTGLPLGIYTVTFKPLAGVYMPPYEAQALLSDQTLVFSGSYVADTVPPTGTLVIGNSEYATGSPLVGLALDAIDEIAGMGTGAQMQFSNDGSTWSTAESYATVKGGWDLTAFGGNTTQGLKTVYARVSDALGNWATFTDTILYVPNRQILEVPTQYSTIQAALDAAQPGDIVHVGPGNYPASLTLRTGVTLQGSGRDRTFFSGGSIVTEANTMMEGFGGYTVIWAVSGPTIVANNTLQTSYPSAIIVSSGVQAFIRNNVFNGAGLLIHDGDLNGTQVTVENNTFVHCVARPAIFLQHSAPGTKVVVRDNIIALNDSGVVEDSPIDTARQHVFTSFNTFWNNTGGNFGGTSLGQGMSSGDVDADPLFVDPTNGNFRTQAASPIVDSGDPNPRFNDPNGTPNDRGAYGGPGATFAPVAAFNALPSTGSVGSIFTFDASKSFDPTGGGVVARWDFDGDGVWDTPFSPLLVVSQRMDTIGTLAVKLEVQNQFGVQTDVTGQIVVQNQNPDAPRSPSVADGGVTVASNTILSWKGGDSDPIDTVSYDVYFGRTSEPPLVSTDQPDTVFTPQSLAPGAYYSWRVVSRDNHGAVTQGPLWSFLTVDSTAIQRLPGDADGNGTVDAEDAKILAANWGATHVMMPGDANRDGVVEQQDARILAANWGKAAGANWREGDFEGDGAVGPKDAAILAAHWGRTSLPVGWNEGDFNGDGIVNAIDAAILAANWTPVIIVPSLPGDADGSGTVDAEDAKIMASNWGKSGMMWADGDFNNDGVVNAIDAAILAAHFGMTLPPPGEDTPSEPLIPVEPVIVDANPFIGPLPIGNTASARQPIQPVQRLGGRGTQQRAYALHAVDLRSPADLLVEIETTPESSAAALDTALAEEYGPAIETASLLNHRAGWSSMVARRQTSRRDDPILGRTALAVDLLLAE